MVNAVGVAQIFCSTAAAHDTRNFVFAQILFLLSMTYGKYWFHLQKKNYCLSLSVALGFWTKFGAQLAQPC
jgi:hypothetical protein